MPIVVTDAGSEHGHVTVHNTDAGTSQQAHQDASSIAEAIKDQQDPS